MNLKKIFITTLLSVTVLTAGNSEVNKTAEFLENNKMLSETMGVEKLLQEDYYVEYDEAGVLFNKFNVSYEYRDFIRQICMIYKIPLTIGITLGQIESKSGHDKNYNNRTETRAYWINGVKCWDDGYMQLNSYYHDYFEEEFYNPELLFSFGYIKRSFDPNDDVTSIQVGLSYLSYLRHYYDGNWEKAISCYNTGYKRVNNNTVLESTKKYTHAILNGHAYIGEGI